MMNSMFSVRGVDEGDLGLSMSVNWMKEIRY
jgi:hypothetical protein